MRKERKWGGGVLWCGHCGISNLNPEHRGVENKAVDSEPVVLRGADAELVVNAVTEIDHTIRERRTPTTVPIWFRCLNMCLRRGSPSTYVTHVLFIPPLFSTFHRFPIMAGLEEVSEDL